MQSSKFKYICIMVATSLAIMCCYLIIYMIRQAFLGNPGNIVNSGFETTEDPDEEEIADKLPTDWVFTEGCVIEPNKSFEGESCLKLPINSTIEMTPVNY